MRVLPVLLIALAWTAPAEAFELRLTGMDSERMVRSEERDRVRARGDGAALVMVDRVGCQLQGAHCEELHSGAVVTGHCEDAYGRGTLRYRGRTIRFFVAGQRCPHANADVERGVLISRSGFIDYVMRTRWQGGSGDVERVRIRLGSRRAMPRSALQCSGCKFLVQVAHALLPVDPTHDQVVAAVERACDYFPEQYRGLCGVVVDRYGSDLVRELLAQREAVAVCQRVGVCPTRRSVRRASC